MDFKEYKDLQDQLLERRQLFRPFRNQRGRDFAWKEESRYWRERR